jgi:hypothetical protein
LKNKKKEKEKLKNIKKRKKVPRDLIPQLKLLINNIRASRYGLKG